MWVGKLSVQLFGWGEPQNVGVSFFLAFVKPGNKTSPRVLEIYASPCDAYQPTIRVHRFPVGNGSSHGFQSGFKLLANSGPMYIDEHAYVWTVEMTWVRFPDLTALKTVMQGKHNADRFWNTASAGKSLSCHVQPK